MATKDMKTEISIEPGILPVAATTAAAVTGLNVDTRGFESVTLSFFADSAFAGTISLQEGDSTTAYTAAGADDVIGTNGDAATSSDILTLGYTGSKRYVRVVATPTTAGDIAATFILGNPHVCDTSANN